MVTGNRLARSPVRRGRPASADPRTILGRPNGDFCTWTDGTPIKCRVSIMPSGSDSLSFTRLLPPLNLPTTSDQWQRHFGKHLRESKDCQRVYSDARHCDLEFSAEELERSLLACEREFKPLRWAIRRSSDGQVAKLYEDVRPLHIRRAILRGLSAFAVAGTDGFPGFEEGNCGLQEKIRLGWTALRL